jgi:hypothetical protein
VCAECRNVHAQMLAGKGNPAKKAEAEELLAKYVK